MCASEPGAAGACWRREPSQSQTLASRRPPGQSLMLGSRWKSVLPYFAWRSRVRLASSAAMALPSLWRSLTRDLSRRRAKVAGSPVMQRRSSRAMANSALVVSKRSQSEGWRVLSATCRPQSQSCWDSWRTGWRARSSADFSTQKSRSTSECGKSRPRPKPPTAVTAMPPARRGSAAISVFQRRVTMESTRAARAVAARSPSPESSKPRRISASCRSYSPRIPAPLLLWSSIAVPPYSAISPRSSLRILMASSIFETKILPSPMRPVRAAVMMA